MDIYEQQQCVIILFAGHFYPAHVAQNYIQKVAHCLAENSARIERYNQNDGCVPCALHHVGPIHSIQQKLKKLMTLRYFSDIIYYNYIFAIISQFLFWLWWPDGYNTLWCCTLKGYSGIGRRCPCYIWLLPPDIVYCHWMWRIDSVGLLSFQSWYPNCFIITVNCFWISLTNSYHFTKFKLRHTYLHCIIIWQI